VAEFIRLTILKCELVSVLGSLARATRKKIPVALWPIPVALQMSKIKHLTKSVAHLKRASCALT